MCPLCRVSRKVGASGPAVGQSPAKTPACRPLGTDRPLIPTEFPHFRSEIYPKHQLYGRAPMSWPGVSGIHARPALRVHMGARSLDEEYRQRTPIIGTTARDTTSPRTSASASNATRMRSGGHGRAWTTINKEAMGTPRGTRRAAGRDSSSGAATAVVVVLKGRLATSSVTRACTWNGSISGGCKEQFRRWQASLCSPEARFSCHADCTPVSHIMGLADIR